MVDINQVYASNSDRLKADDLKKSDGSFSHFKCVIEGATVEDVSAKDDPPAMKVIISLVDKEKDIVLNKTNSFNLASRYGADTDGWIGKAVIVTASLKSFGGKMVPGIDVTAPAPTEAEMEAEYAASAAPAGGGAEDETVPF